jgi:phosphoribosylanthranilate isomerase
MTRIKLCGLSRPCDIEAANALMPDYVGFVFAPQSRRYVTPRLAAELKGMLSPDIAAVGVFVNEAPEIVADLLNSGVIDIAQLHGDETEDDIRRLRQLTGRPLIRAFRIQTAQDAEMAESSSADHVLLDSGAGTGNTFDWQLLRGVDRPYFLAGGLTPDNVENAVRQLKPFAVDVSSGIETEGRKDAEKMAAFAAAVRRAQAGQAGLRSGT